MKRRSVPLKADHNLLPPDTHTLLGVRLRPVIQVRSEGGASLSGHLPDSPNRESAVRSTRRRSSASPTRRLRFEDETETEAESRYLERQRRPVEKQVLVSKPDMNLFLYSRAGLQGQRHVVVKQQGERTMGVGQYDSCGTVLGGGVNQDLGLHLVPHLPDNPDQRLYQPCRRLWTEPIKETYIGSFRPNDGSRRPQAVPNMQVRRRSSQPELNGNQTLLTDQELPENPYADPRVIFTMKQASVGPPGSSSSSSAPCVTSDMRSQNTRLNGMMAGQSVNQKQVDQRRPAGESYGNHRDHGNHGDHQDNRNYRDHGDHRNPGNHRDHRNHRDHGDHRDHGNHRDHRNHRDHGDHRECGDHKDHGKHRDHGDHRDHREDPSWSETTTKNTSPDTAVKIQTPPTSESSSDGHVRQPMRAQLHSDLTALPEEFSSRNKSSRLSLRRLFSSVTRSRTRTGSLDRLDHLDHLSSQPSPPVPCSPAQCGPAPSNLRRSSSLLNLQGSPFLQMRKSSLIQSFVSEKKKDQSDDQSANESAD